MHKSFLQALRSRYGAEYDNESYDPSIFVIGDGKTVKGKKTKAWEMVGMEKTRVQQSRYDRLFVVVLREENIGVALTKKEEEKTHASTIHVPIKRGAVKHVHPSEFPMTDSNNEKNDARTASAAAPSIRSANESKEEKETTWIKSAVDVEDGEKEAVMASTSSSPRPLLNELEAENMSRLEELDLSANPLPLREVGKLIPYFSSLRVLQLSCIPNLFPIVTRKVWQGSAQVNNNCGAAAAASLHHTYPMPLLSSTVLEKLVLNNISLASIAQLLLWMDLPNLSELHLDHNDLHSLPLFSSADESEEEEKGEGRSRDPCIPPSPPSSFGLKKKASGWEVTANANNRASLSTLVWLRDVLRHRRAKGIEKEGNQKAVSHLTEHHKINKEEEEDGPAADLTSPFFSEEDIHLFSLPSIRLLHLGHNQFSTWGDMYAIEHGAPPNPEEHESIRMTLEELKEEKEGTVRMKSLFFFSHFAPSFDPCLGSTLRHAFPSVEQLFLTANPLPNIPLPPSTAELHVKEDCSRNVSHHESHHHDKNKEKEETEAKKSASSSLVPFSSILSRETYEEEFGFLRLLRVLCLRDISSITSTSTLDAIRQLSPRLETFRISYPGLLPQWNDTLSRMFVLASLPSIKVLNRGAVREKERLDAEIFYIQRGRRHREVQEEEKKRREKLITVKEEEEKMNEREEEKEVACAMDREAEVEPSSSLERFISFPLLSLLEKKHEALVMSIYREGWCASMGEAGGEEKEGGDAGGRGSVFTVPLHITLYPENTDITCGGTKRLAANHNDHSSLRHKHAHSMKVLSSLTIGKLKAIVRSIFCIQPEHQQLRYQPGEDAGVMEPPVPLENELETLGYYGVANNAIIGVIDTSLR